MRKTFGKRETDSWITRQTEKKSGYIHVNERVKGKVRDGEIRKKIRQGGTVNRICI